MKRREEIVSELGLNKIVQESIKRHPRFADKRVGFIDGAEWMQKALIEKACKWMKEQVYQEYGGGPLERLIPDTRIEEFRKSMEE